MHVVWVWGMYGPAWGCRHHGHVIIRRWRATCISRGKLTRAAHSREGAGSARIRFCERFCVFELLNDFNQLTPNAAFKAQLHTPIRNPRTPHHHAAGPSPSAPHRPTSWRSIPGRDTYLPPPTHPTAVDFRFQGSGVLWFGEAIDDSQRRYFQLVGILFYFILDFDLILAVDVRCCDHLVHLARSCATLCRFSGSACCCC